MPNMLPNAPFVQTFPATRGRSIQVCEKATHLEIWHPFVNLLPFMPWRCFPGQDRFKKHPPRLPSQWILHLSEGPRASPRPLPFVGRETPGDRGRRAPGSGSRRGPPRGGGRPGGPGSGPAPRRAPARAPVRSEREGRGCGLIVSFSPSGRRHHVEPNLVELKEGGAGSRNGCRLLIAFLSRGRCGSQIKIKLLNSNIGVNFSNSMKKYSSEIGSVL